MSVSLRDDVSPRQIQRLVEQVLQTFYDWPLMLPSNLVYFGRAGVLVEGIGAPLRPQLQRAGHGPAGAEPRGHAAAAGRAASRIRARG